MLRSFRLAFQQPFFMEVFILALWATWTTRNDHIFKGIRANLFRCQKKFKEELDWAVLRANSQRLAGFKVWVQDYRVP